MPRPHVSLNVAMTADGKITDAARSSPTFVSRRDRQRMDHLRSGVDAILLGAATLRAEDYPLQLRDPGAIAERKALGLPPGLSTVVVSRSLRLPAQAKFFRQPLAPSIILASTDSADCSALNLPAAVAVWRLGPTQVDLVALLQRLGQAGMQRIMVEAGGNLNAQLLQLDLIDSLYLTVAPALLGGVQAPGWLAGKGLAMAAHRRLQLHQAEVVGDEIFCHYTLRPAARGAPLADSA
jgi:5-amino-6-(5-phosphoribosylamino)uracil reductase